MIFKNHLPNIYPRLLMPMHTNWMETFEQKFPKNVLQRKPTWFKKCCGDIRITLLK